MHYAVAFSSATDHGRSSRQVAKKMRTLMVNDSAKVQWIRKRKKHTMTRPVSGTLVNKQREYDTRKLEPSDLVSGSRNICGG